MSLFRIQPSRINGRGLFAVRRLPSRRKIGELRGEWVKLPSARQAIELARKIYLVEVSRGYALDCSKGNCFKYLNHSCTPTCYLRVYRRRVEVYTRQTIKAGAELTVNYGSTPHKHGMVCRCGSIACRGVL